jgi:hypothetical protein
MGGRRSDLRLCWLVFGLLALPLLAACSPDPEAGALEHPSSTVGATAPPTPVPATMPTSTEDVTDTTTSSTTTVPAPTTVRPPTLAERFRAAVDAVRVEVVATPIPDHARDSVARVFLLLGRPPSPDELQAGIRAIVVEGRPLTSLADLLLRSPESEVPAPEAPTDRFVSELWQQVTGERATSAQVATWTRQLENGTSPGSMVVAFTESRPAVARTGTSSPRAFPALELDGVDRTTSDSVLRLYTGLLRRFPTHAELAGGVERLREGTPLAAIADEIVESGEYRARRPETAPEDVLRGLYRDVLGRAPDESGMAVWTALLERGSTAGEIAVGFTESPESVKRTATAAPDRATVMVSGDGVLALGDSVMLGAIDALRRSIPGIAVDAEVSRQFDTGLSIVRRLAELDALPDTVVIHLGSNGHVSTASCDEIMSLLAGGEVVVVNVRVPRAWESGNNRVLAACAERHGARLVDWHEGATGLAADGVHIGPDGARQYAALVAAALAEQAAVG